MAVDLREAHPHMEMSRLVSSGTEACMGAIRLARGYTGRDVVIKCEGGYHGGADYLLVKAGSGAATLGEPDSAGVSGVDRKDHCHVAVQRRETLSRNSSQLAEPRWPA